MAETSKALKNGERLPSEMKEEIFSKLSVKDILRSRSVCKPWKTLIDSHGFKKKLFEAAKRSNSCIIWRKSFSEPTLQILYAPFDNVSPPLELNLGEFLNGFVFNSSDIMIVSSGDNNADDLDFRKFGVVNGLICLGWNSFHVVLNPYTRESKWFNAPKKNWVFDLLDNSGINDDVVLNDQLCAFGYDPIGQDYKFLIAHFTSNLTNKGINPKNKVLFQLYSVRNNVWRGAILDFPFIDGIETGDGFMDNGMFYWFVKKCGKKKEDGSFSPAVIVFDFGGEVFDVITLPVDIARGEDTIAVANRGVLEIIMTIDDGKDDEEGSSISEVWVMGKDGSWSRTLSVDLPCKVGRPIGVLKNGELMFEKPSKVDGVKDLVLINPANGSCKEIGINGTELWMFSYVQSLFTIKQ